VPPDARPDLTPDWRVAVYALLLAVFSTLAFTLAPALRACRQDLLPLLRAGEQGVIRGRSRLANILVIAQLAVCVALLTSGGLAYRSLFLIDTTDVFFTRDHLLLAGVNTAGAGTAGEPNVALLERLRERLVATPGVVRASWAIAAPPHSHPRMGAVQASDSRQRVATDITVAGPDYLQALRVPILAGRDFTPADITAAKASAVINQKLAQALWPGQSAAGRTMLLDQAEEPVEVVGVVPNGAFSGVALGGGFAGLGKAERPNFVFLADNRATPGPRTFHVRYSGDLKAVAAAVRAAVREVDPRLPVSIRTMEAEWAEFTSPIRAVTTALGLFAIGALMLASVGLYAVMAFYTARRTRELGIRMALGASPRDAVGTVLKQGLLLTAIGTGIGLVLSAAAARALGSLLFGVTPTDKPTYLVVICLLSTVSLVACYIPARRAARIDPMQALRQE